MKHALTILIALILLTACTSVPTAMPTTSPIITLAPKISVAPTQLPTATSTATLTATPRATDTPRPTNTPRPPTLRDLADTKKIEIGAHINGFWFNNPQWQALVGTEFKWVYIDWGVYWSESEPRQGQFDFSVIDKQVAFAEKYNMKVRAMGLLGPMSPSLLPDWLSNLTKEQMEKAVYDHVFTIVSRYKGRISEWTVITEPYNPPHRKNDVFYNKFGSYDYILIAFRAARAADPTAKLLFEDTQNHTSNGINTSITKRVIDLLRQEKLIDILGEEMHLDGARPPSKSDLINTMRGYGMTVAVTSFDVDMHDVSGSQEEKYAKQAQLYKEALEACLESGVCNNFTLWSVGDKNSWLIRQLGRVNAAPSPFDDDLKPKPAYFALRDVLAGK